MLFVENKNKDEEIEKEIFKPELKLLMYGFGDVENPDPDSMDLLEQYIIEYIQNVSILAYKRSKKRGFNEIKLKDLLFIIKDDKKKFFRVPTLLSFYEEFKKTKKEALTNKKEKHLNDLNEQHR